MVNKMKFEWTVRNIIITNINPQKLNVGSDVYASIRGPNITCQKL